MERIDLVSEFNLEEMEAINMFRVEERYALEDRMLAAVMEGNTEEALKALAEFSSFPMPRYKGAEISVEKRKIPLISMNTLLRKSVQMASVHPAHIDHVSAKFAKIILEAETKEELDSLSKEMVRKYCLLVRSYSLKGYTDITQDALHYIDFNLTEELSLAKVAEKLNVNKKYLSQKFKTETGQTITEYINSKRVQESLKYLSTTNLSISDVALRVGMYDMNYYSRVFKKVMDMTPSEYRNMIQS